MEMMEIVEMVKMEINSEYFAASEMEAARKYFAT